jgi:hypothetical protein
VLFQDTDRIPNKSFIQVRLLQDTSRIPRFRGKNTLKRLYNNKVGMFTQASTMNKPKT